MKVYVLMYEDFNDCSNYKAVSVFSSLEKARSIMEKDIKDKAEDLEELTEDYHGNNGACWSEPGYYETNHVEWTIYERDIID